jgi:hypothetical protein
MRRGRESALSDAPPVATEPFEIPRLSAWNARVSRADEIALVGTTRRLIHRTAASPVGIALPGFSGSSSGLTRRARAARSVSRAANRSFNAPISPSVPIGYAVGAWSSGAIDEAHLTRRLPFSRCYRDFLNPPYPFLRVFRVAVGCDRAGLVHLLQIGSMASFWYDVIWRRSQTPLRSIRRDRSVTCSTLKDANGA